MEFESRDKQQPTEELRDELREVKDPDDEDEGDESGELARV